MNCTELEALATDPQGFKRGLRSGLLTDSTRIFTTDPTTLVKELTGKFVKGRVNYVNCVKLPNGTELRFSFYDTIKTPLNSKGKAIPDKESFVSYLQVTVYPTNDRPYTFTLFADQLPWKNGKAKATAAHEANKAKLVELATALGIDMTCDRAWCTVYSEGWDK